MTINTQATLAHFFRKWDSSELESLMNAGNRRMLHRDIARLAVIADHDRMSRRLNAEVIHELFAVGLKLQALAAQIDDITVRLQVEETISATDRAIHSVRCMVLDSTIPQDRSLKSSDA